MGLTQPEAAKYIQVSVARDLECGVNRMTDSLREDAGRLICAHQKKSVSLDNKRNMKRRPDTKQGFAARMPWRRKAKETFSYRIDLVIVRHPVRRVIGKACKKGSRAVAAVALLLSFATACAPEHTDHDETIGKLDSLMERSKALEQEKLYRLANLRRRREQAVSASDRYMAASLLYDAYVTYRSDSALKYVDDKLAVARETGNREWEVGSLIEKAEVLAASGLLSQSVNVMRSIDSGTLPRDLLIAYYGQMIFLYSHLGNYAEGSVNDYYVREREYKDSIMSVIDASHPEYLWYKGWDLLGTNRPCGQTIAALRRKLAKSTLDSRQDAKDAYILSKLYESVGDHGNGKHYMALSAMADVRIVNAEIASLEDLSKMMFEENDIDHAFAYISYSLNKAIAYPNRVKAFSISRTIETIYQVYQAKNVRQQERIRWSLLLACMLAAVLIASVAVIIAQNAKLKRQGAHLDEANKSLSHHVAKLSEAQEQLNEANERLKDLNADLQLKNEELREANYVKEEYIGYVFSICSNYISKLEALKSNIHRKAVVKKYKEIEADTANFDMKAELKDFYHLFDTIFLHIYPNFVNDFNNLLQEGSKIIPKEGELLNTELRIYALVRIGITDSMKIAEFLHCSAQTVYNNSFKVRGKTKLSKREFVEAVRKLGTFVGGV